MTQKPIQYFDSEYLQRCKGMSPDQIIEFEENFRELMSHPSRKSSLVNITPSLLEKFKKQAAKKNIPYQTQLEKLIREWLSEEN